MKKLGKKHDVFVCASFLKIYRTRIAGSLLNAFVSFDEFDERKKVRYEKSGVDII